MHIYSNIHFLDTCIAYMCHITENGRIDLSILADNKHELLVKNENTFY